MPAWPLSESVRISHWAPTSPVPTWPRLTWSMFRTRLATTDSRFSGGTIPKYSGRMLEVCVPLSYMPLKGLKNLFWKASFTFAADDSNSAASAGLSRICAYRASSLSNS